MDCRTDIFEKLSKVFIAKGQAGVEELKVSTQKGCVDELGPRSGADVGSPGRGSPCLGNAPWELGMKKGRWSPTFNRKKADGEGQRRIGLWAD